MRNMNEKAARLYDLGRRIKEMEEERAALRGEFGERGTCATPDYIVTVVERTREALKGIEKVAEIFGRKTLDDAGLISQTRYKQVTVERRTKEAA